MDRNSSLLMAGYVFEYNVSMDKPGQHIGYIADRLNDMGLVAKLGKGETEVSATTVRRLTDPEDMERYIARVAEWCADDDYYRGPWHVYVGKIISAEHGAVDLATIQKALNEVKKDFPEPKVLHCTRDIYIDWGY